MYDDVSSFSYDRNVKNLQPKKFFSIRSKSNRIKSTNPILALPCDSKPQSTHREEGNNLDRSLGMNQIGGIELMDCHVNPSNLNSIRWDEIRIDSRIAICWVDNIQRNNQHKRTTNNIKRYSHMIVGVIDLSSYRHPLTLIDSH